MSTKKDLAEKYANQLKRAVSDRVDVRRVLGDITREFGGPAGLAREFKQEYTACGDAHHIRVRMLTDLMKLMATVTQYEDELDALTDEDYEAEMRIVLTELNLAPEDSPEPLEGPREPVPAETG